MTGRARLAASAIAVAAVHWFFVPSAAAAQPGKFHPRVSIGQQAPGFRDLLATDGRRYSLADFAKSRVVVIVFTANHCPIAAAYESRLLAIQRDYTKRGVQLVAISCSRLPQDGLQSMRERAAKSGYNFPYLHDPQQKVGRAYSATVTPDVFVLDDQRRICYMGAIDDGWHDGESAKRPYLRQTLDALLAGKEPKPAETRAIGCEIQYDQP